MGGSNATFPQYQAGDGLAHGTLNRLLRIIQGARGIDGITVKVKETGLEVRGTPSAFSYPHPFQAVDINSETGTVKITAGWIIHGTKAVPVPEATVSIGGGTYDAPVYVALRYTYGQVAGSILSSTVANFPAPTTTMWQQPVVSFYRVEGIITLREVLWDSIVILPSVFSPS